MTDEERKDVFLNLLKEKGLSSPAGKYWDRFCKYIKRNAENPDDEKLLNPLILGGAIASHAVKHERLSEHLDWAIRHSCFDKALLYLEKMPEGHWNKCYRPEEWDEEHPWSRGDW